MFVVVTVVDAFVVSFVLPPGVPDGTVVIVDNDIVVVVAVLL